MSFYELMENETFCLHSFTQELMKSKGFERLLKQDVNICSVLTSDANQLMDSAQ